MKPLPLIIAHRGASAHAPENTLAAFQAAVEAGVDGVEFDVRLAKDGVPIVIHDSKLRRTALRHGRVSDYTSHELGKIDVGSWFNERNPKRANEKFLRETIPTLEDVLTLMETFPGLIYIELKPTKNDLNELVRAVCDVIRPLPLLPQMIVKSFKLAAISEVRHHLPNVQTAALFGPAIKNLLRRRKHIITIAHEFEAQQLSLHHSLMSRNLASRAAHAQMPITIWTTDRRRWIKQCKKFCIRALITNDPVKLLSARSLIKRGG